MKHGLRPWPCARVALTVFAVWLLAEAFVLLGLSVVSSASSSDGLRLYGLALAVVPVGFILPVGVALLASRDSILGWLRIERDDVTPAAFVAAAIALLACCEACSVLIGLACSAVRALADAIASSNEDPFASIAAGFTGLPSSRDSYGVLGEVAVLLSCLVLMRLAPTIARLPRVTRASGAPA